MNTYSYTHTYTQPHVLYARYTYLHVRNFLVMCVLVPRGEIEVPCLSRVAIGPASSFLLGTQTSHTLPGILALINYDA